MFAEHAMQAAEIVGTLAEDVRSSAALYGKYMTKAVTKVRNCWSAACLCTCSMLAEAGSRTAVQNSTLIAVSLLMLCSMASSFRRAMVALTAASRGLPGWQD